VYTSDYIPLPKVEISVDDTLLDKTITLINKYSTFALVDMSHATTPYINAINRDKKISAGEIKSYFIKNNPFKHDK
jgi:uncharacterized phage-associated protein